MSLFFHIVKEGENPEQSNNQNQFFNNNVSTSDNQQINTKNIVDNIDSNMANQVGNSSLIITETSNNKKQKVETSFSNCCRSVLISLVVFAIAICVFFGPSLSSLFVDMTGLEEIKVIDLLKEGGNDKFISLSIIAVCWSAFSYSLLSLLACWFSVKDSFRKKYLPKTDIKPYKTFTSIFFILFYVLDYWIVITNCNRFVDNINNNEFVDFFKESSYFGTIDFLPVICIAIVTVFLLITIILCNKTTDKKNAN